ncbi:hypothetical protein Bhyg_02754 [Pseudolycoriella hygida]|uniref:Uncharacterized protein n=1 Tax=Pseudolycoriella hygida TaxID=35572 RepID=A0A9Q0NC15_9DIPT|nr:hypothetical protein Bhyg_02754 [Pseudolycoriella hygida]
MGGYNTAQMYSMKKLYDSWKCQQKYPNYARNETVKIRLNRKFGNTYRPFMVNAEQDLCTLSSDNSMESIVTKMLNLKERKKYGNWYQPCPVSGRRYEIDTPMDSSKMPAVAMHGNFRLDLIGLKMSTENELTPGLPVHLHTMTYPDLTTTIQLNNAVSLLEKASVYVQANRITTGRV